MNQHQDDKLEAVVHRILRSVPERKAPAGLERRVMAEIARRAALPWWRKSFAHWPGIVRALFLALGGVAAVAVVFALYLLAHTTGAGRISQGLSGLYAWVLVGRDVTAAASMRLRAFAASLPPVLLYGGAATIAICYASVGVLAAAAFRALRPATHNS
ncbi:MAG TPA: hypothetical protein VGG37_01240 [Opitutaceae bacterium]|jgi:hypothetical protein